jgi:hypothetical protein
MTKKTAPVTVPETSDSAPASKRSRKSAVQAEPKVEAPVVEAPVVEAPVVAPAVVEAAGVEPAVVETAAVETPVEAKPAKQKKTRLVRDSFTMPETEYQLIAAIKTRCLVAGVAAKKSEILRAAISGLARLDDAELLAALQGIETIKTGRPARNAK